MEGYLNVNLFYSRQLLLQHNISVKDPLTIDLSEDLKKKSFLLDIDNFLFMPTLVTDSAISGSVCGSLNSHGFVGVVNYMFHQPLGSFWNVTNTMVQFDV
jgi:hypothetical protein